MALQDFTNERETWDYISPDTGRATRMITFKQDLGFIILSLLTIVVAVFMRGVFDFLRFAVCQVFDFLLREDDGTRSQAQDVEAQEVLWEIAGPFDILIEILTRPGRILPVSRGNILMQSFIFLSLALGLGSLALAALISKVVTDNIVLLRDPNCAYWEVVPNGTRQIDEILMRNSTEGPTVSELAEYSYLLPQLSAVVRNGSETSYFYRQVCGGEISGPACKTLLMDPLPQTRIHGQKCPFMPDQCVGGDNSAYTIDTGNISIAHFGVNQRTSLKFRRITTCAPLNITSYAVSDRGDFSFVKHWGVNITHSIRNDTAAAYAVTAIPPRVGREVHPNLQPTGQLTGQPPTGQPSGVGNISIVVISRNDLPHLHRNEDDIFKANDRKEIVPNFPMFFPKWEDRLSAIGCVEKQILCTDTACSREVGVLRNAEGLTGLDDFNRTLSEVDQGIIGLMYPHFTVGQTIADAARGLGNRLVASQNLISLPTQSGRIVELQTTLSEDQWKAEVDAWFDIVLTIMQFATIYFPITPNFFTSDFLHNGMQQESKMICKSIKIRSDAHITFNLDRIAIILGTTGSFAALAGLRSLLERIMGEKTWRFLRMVRPPNRRHSLRN